MSKSNVGTWAWVALVASLGGARPSDAAEVPAPAAADAYVQELTAWRAEREARLRAEDGWLTLAGLFWLKPGANSVGSAADNDVVLPPAAPARALRLELRADGVTYALEPGAPVPTVQGAPAPPAGALASDAGGQPTVLAFGPVSLHVIKRGERHGVRVKDRDSAARRDFGGRRWYAPDPAWRVAARFVPHAKPTRVRVPNVLGEVSEMESPGQAVFTVEGREVRLTPVLESADADELFFIFKDATAGRDTYPAGRFLYAPLPKDGAVTLDFNRAVSPPCAFTPYATCPLPPAGNRLTIAIPAGEKADAHH